MRLRRLRKFAFKFRFVSLSFSLIPEQVELDVEQLSGSLTLPNPINILGEIGNRQKKKNQENVSFFLSLPPKVSPALTDTPKK